MEKLPATAPELLDDERLVALLRAQPTIGVGHLYDRYGRLVYSVALRIVHDHGIAEEVTQDVFVRCWRNIDHFQPERGSLASWLLTIAHHRAIDELRSRYGKEMRRSLPDEKLALLATSDPALDEALIRSEVRNALSTLPPTQRQVIELVFWGGLTRREVAEQLHVPLGTVHTRLRLGIDKLRTLFALFFEQE